MDEKLARYIAYKVQQLNSDNILRIKSDINGLTDVIIRASQFDKYEEFTDRMDEMNKQCIKEVSQIIDNSTLPKIEEAPAILSENLRKHNQIELRHVCSCCSESVEYLYGDEQICYDCMTINFFEEE